MRVINNGVKSMSKINCYFNKLDYQTSNKVIYIFYETVNRTKYFVNFKILLILLKFPWFKLSIDRFSCIIAFHFPYIIAYILSPKNK
jgi:hypothetical protein